VLLVLLRTPAIERGDELLEHSDKLLGLARGRAERRVARWEKSVQERPQWINARSEKVPASKLLRSLAATPEGRVLTPADGWYEWMYPEWQLAVAQSVL
jgi:putative SOS response-associated peptidase YedK